MTPDLPTAGLPQDPPNYAGEVVWGGRSISGFVFDTSDPSREIVVELVLDGWPSEIARAHHFNNRLFELGYENPHRGFVFNLPRALMTTIRSAEVRVANTMEPIGQTLDFARETWPEDVSLGPGAIQWAGGLRFTGWLAPRPAVFPAGSPPLLASRPDDLAASQIESGETPQAQKNQEAGGILAVRGLIEEEAVAESTAKGWTTVFHGQERVAVKRLDIHLPMRFADGSVHHVDFITSDGVSLPGSPVSFVAFEDGLEAFCASHGLESQRLRGRLFDQLIPASVPFSWVEAWMDRFTTFETRDAPERAAAVILFGESGVDKSLDSLEPCGKYWILGVLPVDPASGRFDPADLIAFLEDAGASFDTVVFAAAGTCFQAGALQILAQTLDDDPKVTGVYADVLAGQDEGPPLPLALPRFDYERLLEQGVGAQVFALRRREALDFAARGAATAYRLFNMALDGVSEAGFDPDAGPRHIPGVLATIPALDVPVSTRALKDATSAHLKARGVDAGVRDGDGTLMPAVRVHRNAAPERITFVLSASGPLDLIEPSIDAILTHQTKHEVELVVTRARTLDQLSVNYLDRIDGRFARVIGTPQAFNIASAYNAGARLSVSPYIGFVEQGVVIMQGWLDEVLSRCAEGDAGACGGLLTWPDGVIIEAGAVLNLKTGSASAFRGCEASHPGYADMLRVARSCSALTFSAAVTKRDDFVREGGFDERVFTRFFWHLHYCLRLQKRSRRMVFTPHARAIQLGANSQSQEKSAQAAYRRELAGLLSRWGDSLVVDPFYSPLLALNGDVYSALAWPPRQNFESRGIIATDRIG